MNLTCETILDFYEHKNKKILCQIKVKSLKGHKPKNTCRSLTPEQWIAYDKKLEKLITTTTNWSDGKCLKFNISPSIIVEVQKSKLSAKNFHICLDSSSATAEDSNGEIETDFILECVLDFQEQIPLTSSIDSQEYVPQVETSPEGKQNSRLTYEPYTPSKRLNRASSFNGIKSTNIHLPEANEDTYSPKPLYEIAEVDPQVTEDIPKYTPAPIKTISNSSGNKPRNEANPSKKYKSQKTNLNYKLESEYIPISQEIALNNVPVYIPTPIDNTQTNALKTNIRKHKKRSKTIDEYPLQLLDFNKDKYKTIEEELEREKQEIKSYEKRLSIKRSKTIDEMPSALKHNIEPYFPESENNLDKELKSSDKPETLNVKSTNNLVFSAENKLTTCSKDAINSLYLIAKEIHKYTNQKESSKINKDTTQDKVVVNENNPCLRRSDRSLSKPKRFIEEQPNLLKKHKEKSKTSPKTRELFGTDDEDDDEVRIANKNNAKIKNHDKYKLKSSSKLENSLNEKYHKSSSSSSSSSSTKKKRKRHKSNECEQEKRDINKWLSKKKYSSSQNRAKSPPILNSNSKFTSPVEVEFFKNKILEQKENKIG